MRISIENFKSIRKLQRFEIKPLTVLSGVNSSGKSSFLQLLLLLKQTVELDSLREVLLLKGGLYEVENYIDIVHNKDSNNIIKVTFEFNKAEFSQIDAKTISIFNTFGDYDCIVDLEYTIQNNKAIINLFMVTFKFADKDKEKQFINLKSNIDNTFSIETNTGFFGDDLFGVEQNFTNITYSSIFPMYYESEKEEEFYNFETKQIEVGILKFKEFILMEDIKGIISFFLSNISYIEPNREKPKDNYTILKNHKNVGIRGEFTAQILQENATQPITFCTIKEKEDNSGITYKEITKTLTEAVKYWMCDIFEVAADIRAEKENDTYNIILISQSGLETSIKHVGFGISQLLPIIVEGLRMPKNGTFIIEQPEIHLHPKIQSKLYDFLYSLTNHGKKVIVETHSSHFITRMRRRIAEDESNEMDDNIGLTFIEDNLFKSIELNDYGILNYYPKDFIEPSNEELRAIVKAQMNKRRKDAKL